MQPVAHRRRAPADQSTVPARLGTGSSTYSVVQPRGASDGSLSEGTVTSRDGSGISRPCVDQRVEGAVPGLAEVDVVVARSRSRHGPRAPTCQTTAEGE